MAKNRTQSVKRAHQQEAWESLLSLVRKHPGIRPSEINRLLDRKQTDGLRNALIKRGLIKKKKDGGAMRYYPV
jgi:predicted transcriptional regulator